MGSGLRPPSHRRSFVLVAWVPGRFNAQWAHCFTFFYGCGPNGARECGFAAQRSEVGSLCLAPFVRLLVQRSCTYRTLTGVTKSHYTFEDTPEGVWSTWSYGQPWSRRDQLTSWPY